MSYEENVKINDRIEAAMKIATNAERERCARIAESYGGSKFEYHCVGQEIAREIRKGE